MAFVFVTNEDWPTVKKFFDKNQYNFPVYNSMNALHVGFTETNSILVSCLINRIGEIF